MRDAIFQWTRPIESLGFQFQHARPFRHLVLDNVLPERFVDQVIDAFPDEEHMERHIEEEHDDKYTATDMRKLGVVFRELQESIQSDMFLEELSDITGIPNLVPDPLDTEGGAHLGVNGSFIDIHTDPNYVEDKGLYRRLSLILYFNRGWRGDWGGSLELWNAGKSRAESVVEPMANRCVIFETSSTSFHGYRKIRLPEDSPGPRKSFQVFYYTVEPPEGDEVSSERTYKEWNGETSEGALHQKLEKGGYLSTIKNLLTGKRG